MTLSDEDARPGKGLWPLVLSALVLVAISGILFSLRFKLWLSIPVGWIGFGLLLYTLILRFFPPTPLLLKEKPLDGPAPDPVGEPFRIRDVPAMFFGLFFMSVVAPFFAILLVPAVIFRVRINRRWRQKFPNASKAEIREYLDTLLRSLDIPLPENYQLSPDDSLICAYQTAYGPATTPDKTEIEKLAQQFSQRYGVEVLNLLREDMTVGELYALIQHSKSS